MVGKSLSPPDGNFALTMKYICMKKERNLRFTKAVREEMARRRLTRATESVVRKVINSPVERGYFVSVDHLLVMDRRRRLGKLPNMSSDNRAMWTEIFNAFDSYMMENPEATRTRAAIHVVSRGRASRFYISEENANTILLSL